MKKNLILLLLSVTTINFAQEAKKEIEKTKMDAFASKTGTIIKFTDYKLSGLKQSMGRLTETRIRKINSGILTTFFFQIEKIGQYGSSTASIEHSDLLEVIKAINSLKSEAEKDLASNPDYLENKFTTADGFQVGYYVSKGKINWYIRLEKYGSDNTLFIENVELIEKSFNEAKNKIDELKIK